MAVATNGYDANKLVTRYQNGVLITDRLLPPWPGLGRVITLRMRYPKLRVMFISSGVPDDAWLAKQLGATDYLPWPITGQGLIQLLH